MTRIAIAFSSLLVSGMLLAGQQSDRRTTGARPTEFQAAATGCPSEAQSKPTMPLPADTFIELERTECFGPCPMYTVRIGLDGVVTWTGKRYVHVTGLENSRIEPSKAHQLIDNIISSGFWSLCHKYALANASVSDIPSVIMRLHSGDRDNYVSHYQPNEFNTAPKWLVPIQEEIDTLTDTHRWIHGDPRLETLAKVRPRERTIPFEALGMPFGVRGDARGPKPGLTDLMKASIMGDVDEVRRLLGEKADPNARDASGWTPLMYAMAASTSQPARILLNAGADPNARSEEQQTALMGLSGELRLQLEKLELLIAAGADVNAVDSDGRSALMYSIYGLLTDRDQGLSRVGFIAALRKAGARTDLRDGNGLTVFDYLEEESKLYASTAASLIDTVRQALLQQ